MALTSKKDIAKSVKTLLVMLQSVRNQQVTITLRNDTIVRGTILKVDACMNVELQDAVVEPDLFYCTEPANHHQLVVDNKQICEPNPEDDDSMANSKNKNSGANTISNHNDRHTNLSTGKQFNDDHGDDQQRQQQHQVVPTLHDYFIVKGSRIRHIDLPNDCDLVASAKSEIERIRNRRKPWSKRDIVRSS